MPYPATPGARPRLHNDILYYEFPIFDAFADRFRAVFSARLGGVSQGCFSSLNLGVNRGDDPAAVRENFARFGAAIGFDMDRSVMTQQSHTVNIRIATAGDAGKGLVRDRDYHDIDSLITGEPDLPLLTQYADCTPLIFYAADKHIAANSHSGWRGTVDGMAAHTVKALMDLGCDPRHIFVAMGPSAGPCCYEVDAETAECFAAYNTCANGPAARPIPGKPGKFLADMWYVNKKLLLQSGVPEQNISVSGLCTICHNDIFYSHRVQGEARGAMIAAAMLL